MSRQVLMIATAALLLAAATLDAKEKPQPRSDGEKIKGTWVCVSMERNGKAIPEDQFKGNQLVMDGETFAFSVGNRLVARGIRKLDPSQRPKAVDDTHTEGSFKGKTYLGIYELTDNTFKTCNGSAGQPRPKAFATTPGSGLLLVVYKRAQPPAK
ncbi:MAG TPA: TIGR03067 domain-containing protein [Isosphaeraceae bacterium]|jgi:uncharacterized protein (TIGR03067 family)|nr:TIGR03067 domain-containing protein [Isosphaeraceae bacterium]